MERSLGVFVARANDVARRAVANAGWWAVIFGSLGALWFWPSTDHPHMDIRQRAHSRQ